MVSGRVELISCVRFFKHIIWRYSAFLWAVLKPLGIWGAFGFAAVDSAAFAMPLDPVIASYVYGDPSRFLLYALMASAGSVLGSFIIYAIGYKGGELLLLKRVSQRRFEAIRTRFEDREFWALMIPSMLPPPAPFKLFVLSAGVFEMRPGHFAAAIFTGRFIRFMALSLLTLKFGPQVVHVVGSLLRQHLELTAVVVVLSIAAVYVIYRLWKKPVTQLKEELEHEPPVAGE